MLHTCIFFKYMFKWAIILNISIKLCIASGEPGEARQGIGIKKFQKVRKLFANKNPGTKKQSCIK